MTDETKIAEGLNRRALISAAAFGAGALTSGVLPALTGMQGTAHAATGQGIKMAFKIHRTLK